MKTPTILGLAFALCTTAGSASAQFVPNETLVSSNPALVDAEYSQQRNMIVWTDRIGRLWLANVNTTTGAIEPSNGMGTQLLPALGSIKGIPEFMWNGPEWLSTVDGDEIVFGYYLGDQMSLQTARMSMFAYDKPTATWKQSWFGPTDAPRMFDVTSHTPNDTNPQIMYFDPNYNHYWRNIRDPASEEVLLTPNVLPPGDKAWRFADGARAIPFVQRVDNVSQVYVYMLDTQTIRQVTFDDGDKDPSEGRTVPRMWASPDFGTMVVSTFVNGNELRVYKQGATPAAPWVRIYSEKLPANMVAGSPETFTYHKKSYLSFCVYVDGRDYPTEVWVSGINSADPIFRRVSDDTTDEARNDPEVYTTSQYGPRIYFNRYKATMSPGHPMCKDCSEGVYSSDAGLLGQ